MRGQTRGALAGMTQDNKSHIKVLPKKGSINLPTFCCLLVIWAFKGIPRSSMDNKRTVLPLRKDSKPSPTAVPLGNKN